MTNYGDSRLTHIWTDSNRFQIPFTKSVEPDLYFNLKLELEKKFCKSLSTYFELWQPNFDGNRIVSVTSCRSWTKAPESESLSFPSKENRVIKLKIRFNDPNLSSVESARYSLISVMARNLEGEANYHPWTSEELSMTKPIVSLKHSKK